MGEQLFLYLFTVASGIVSVFVIYWFGTKKPANQEMFRPRSRKVTPHPELRRYSREFKKEILTVNGYIHVAIGYGLANCIMIEGKGHIQNLCVLLLNEI